MTVPYAVGDRVNVLHLCPTWGSVLQTLPVSSIVPIPNHDTPFRVGVRRGDGSELYFNVDRAGRDRHGYLTRT